jgi:predicted RNA binding protein YcfA (HicA-like mRNA interferase family)
MPDVPVLNGKKLLQILNRMGFVVVRINGSHHRLKHPDGRATVVPIHANKDLPKGLLRSIICEDLEISVEEFMNFLK